MKLSKMIKMKRSIKNRIAATLLLAASLGGHNYKASAAHYVDSRNVKNNEQSTSLPLWAKVGIPVVALAAVGYIIPSSKNKLWKNDPHGIIKFLTWYKALRGTCIKNSILNMLLNPVFMESIETFLSRCKEYNNGKDINKDFIEECKGEYDRHSRCNCKNKYDDLSSRIAKCEVMKKYYSICHYDNCLAIKEMWQHTRNTSPDRDYIGIKDLNNEDDPSSSVYLYPEDFYLTLNNIAPDLFGNLTTIKTYKTPPLLMAAGSVLKQNSGELAKFRKSGETTCYTLNGTDYFVGGAVLRIGKGHSVYAHFLYDDNNKLSRVIVQDPNSKSNNNKKAYVYEIGVDVMNRMLNGETVNGWRIYDFVSLIRSDKFIEHKNYWNEKSLPR